MDYTENKRIICDEWETILSQMTGRSKDGKGYICPLCGHGTNGDGLIKNKKSETGQGIKCFGCGFSGNIIDLYMKINNLEYSDAIKELNNLLGLNIDDYDDFHKKDDIKQGEMIKTPYSGDMGENSDIDNTEYYKKCVDRLENDLKARLYLSGRGISLGTAIKYWIGYDPDADPAGSGYKAKRLIMPTSKAHYVGRSIEDETPKKYSKINNKGAKPSIFNGKALREKTDIVFVTEGIFDALSVIEVGGQAVATCSAGNYNMIVDALKKYGTEKVLILCFDNDKAGQDRQDDLINKLREIKAKYITADICNGEKDPNDALKKNRAQFEAIVKEAIKEAKENPITAEKDAEIEREKYYQNVSVAYSLQGFIDGIKDSVNTPCISTGFKNLDEQLDGGLYEGLYIFGAVSSLGKTTLTLQVLDQIANAGQDVLIFSLEMAKNELIAKSISRQSYINSEARGNSEIARTARGITDGKRYYNYTDEVKALINESIESYNQFADHVFIIEGIGDINADKIRKAISDHVRITGNNPVVMVDYIQIVAPHNERATEKQVIDKTVIELKRISRDYKIPVIGISSFNRMNYTQEANMTAFKESGAVEYSADVLIGLQYKGIGDKDFDLYNAMQSRPREIELRVLKNRNGIAGKKVQFEYFPAFNYFQEVSNNKSDDITRR